MERTKRMEETEGEKVGAERKQTRAPTARPPCSVVVEKCGRSCVAMMDDDDCHEVICASPCFDLLLWWLLAWLAWICPEA